MKKTYNRVSCNRKEIKKNEIAELTFKLNEIDIKEITKTIFFNISRYVQERKYSYADLSEITGISAAHLCNVLQGRKSNVSLEILLKLVIVLDLIPENYFPFEMTQKNENDSKISEYILRGLSEDKARFIAKYIQKIGEEDC